MAFGRVDGVFMAWPRGGKNKAGEEAYRPRAVDGRAIQSAIPWTPSDPSVSLGGGSLRNEVDGYRHPLGAVPPAIPSFPIFDGVRGDGSGRRWVHHGWGNAIPHPWGGESHPHGRTEGSPIIPPHQRWGVRWP